MIFDEYVAGLIFALAVLAVIVFRDYAQHRNGIEALWKSLYEPMMRRIEELEGSMEAMEAIRQAQNERIRFLESENLSLHRKLTALIKQLRDLGVMPDWNYLTFGDDELEYLNAQERKRQMEEAADDTGEGG